MSSTFKVICDFKGCGIEVGTAKTLRYRAVFTDWQQTEDEVSVDLCASHMKAIAQNLNAIPGHFQRGLPQ